MSRIEKAVIEASKESTALRDLLRYQDAYKEASVVFVDNKISYSVVLACFYAIKTYAVWMAETANADKNFVTSLKNADRADINWYEIVYIMMDYIPSLKALIEKHIDESD